VESDNRGYTIAVDGEAMTGDANYYCSVGRHCCLIGIRACHKGNKKINIRAVCVQKNEKKKKTPLYLDR